MLFYFQTSNSEELNKTNIYNFCPSRVNHIYIIFFLQVELLVLDGSQIRSLIQSITISETDSLKC